MDFSKNNLEVLTGAGQRTSGNYLGASAVQFKDEKGELVGYENPCNPDFEYSYIPFSSNGIPYIKLNA